MKNMKNGTKILAAVAAMFTVYACGSGDYPPAPVPTPPPLPAPVVEEDPISKFNTIWSVNASDIAIDAREQRTLAAFLGFNTFHYSRKVGDCKYGYLGESYGMGGCFTAGDTMRNYFTNNSSINIWVYPAPKSIGSMVSQLHIRFAANVDEATNDVIPGDAYFDISVSTSYTSATVKLATVVAPLVVTDQCPTGYTDCQKLEVTLGDDCGNVKFVAYAWHNRLIKPTFSFYNYASSYKSGSCYVGGKLPSNLLKNHSYPDSMPEFIDMDNYDPSRGKILRTTTLPDLIEE
ncbi:MAG: hypothetical protein V1647_04975 [Pseudomonadota bacterium]